MTNRSYVLDILVGFLLITTIYFLVGQRNESEQLTNIANYNKQINIQNQDLLERVKSCTDPAGACYRANTARSASVVAQLNRAVLLSSFCASRAKYKYPADVQKCMRQLKNK